MYYSYKSKKKNRKIYKVLLLAIAVAAAGYFGIKYQQYVLFWKYTYNKISDEVGKASKISDIEKKRIRLLEINEICDNYNKEHQLSSESFLLNGRIHLQLGEIYSGRTFSEFIIYNYDNSIDRKARSEFIKAIRDTRKGVALSKPGDVDPEYLITEAKACYYCNYYGIQDIYNIIGEMSDLENLMDVEDVRFLAIVNILNKKEDYGLGILNRYGMISSDMNGRFFLASAYNIAGKFTDAIVSFKYILENCSENNLIKLACINLGKIYFNQSLFRESLEQFTNALELDNEDNMPKIWIGKNYSAMGEKQKARLIWSEVLVSDQSNMEVRKLLGI